MRTLTSCLLASALVAAAACSGDDGGNNPQPDAGPDAPPAATCGTPAGTISTFPGTFSGTTAGGANNFTVAEGACADEVSYFAPAGFDTSVALTGLTAGTTYLATLTSSSDMSIYIASSCDAMGPAAGACLAFRDQTLMGERVPFVAPAGGTVYAIVDAEMTSAAGPFTLDVVAAECSDDSGCSGATPRCVDFTCVACTASSDCSGATPACNVDTNTCVQCIDDTTCSGATPACNTTTNTCVQCTTSFDCPTSGAAVCDATGTCVAGAGTCTGDTAGEPDNGPADARQVTFPTPSTPTVVNAGICGTTNGDDWYKVTAAAAGGLKIAVTWTATADIDVRLFDATGTVVDTGLSTNTADETFVATLPRAGTYYVQLHQYTSSSGTPSDTVVPYTLTLSVPECINDFQCTSGGSPVCDTGNGVCVAGPDMCTGDVGEPDDGPAAARDLTGAVGTPVAQTAAICNTPGSEADWYKVTVAAGQGVTINTSFDAANDLDVSVFDATGRLEGLTFWKNPEVVTLTYLPAGTHYIRVVAFASPALVAAVPYTITATRSAAQTCASRTDCAATYDTQIYRGACTAGACQFIPAGAGAQGSPCDSADDCTGGECSYLPFEADAQKSVCSKTCTTTADCAVLGTGYTCTTGFTTNICVPSCGSDMECGADVQGTPPTGATWAYLTCTAGSCGA